MNEKIKGKYPMNNFEALVSKIEQIAKNKPHIIIGITGFGGSGKSHLADRP